MAAGVYIHIPFCVRKCLYCDFISGCGTDEEKAVYNQALLNEIKTTEISKCVDTIFFGGGTPSVYPVAYIGEIIETLDRKNILSENCEITLEANPGTIDLEKLRYYKRIGINRLSIGLQSTEINELKILGRIHDYGQFLESFDNARKAGFDNINIDIMSALPSQTVSSYEKTLKRVMELNSEHISAYSLIIEEGTPFYEKYGETNASEKTTIPDRTNASDKTNVSKTNTSGEPDKSGNTGCKYTHSDAASDINGKKDKNTIMHDNTCLPSEDEEREMYVLTKQMLAENGYLRYEISNYAKSGYECRHNLKYWNREDYYGFGVSAASLVDNVRYTNISDRNIYTQNNGEINKIRSEKHLLTEEEQMEEFMFLGLRKSEGISVNEFERKFDKKIEAVYGRIIQKAVEQGLLIRNETKSRICLSDRGIDVSNVVMAEFLL